MNGDFHTDQQLDALYRLNMGNDLDIELLRGAIITMETEAARLKDAGQLTESEKWDRKTAAARKKLAGLLPPRMGG